MTSYEVSLITSMFVEKENMIDLDAMRYARVDDHCQIFVFAWTLSVARFLKTKNSRWHQVRLMPTIGGLDQTNRRKAFH